jgi:CheY-like chemotaxis protein
LRSKEFGVREAEKAAEAFEAIAAQRPALILMDLPLPDVSGPEATRRLKADPWARAIPVVAVTAYAMPGGRERALAAGRAGSIPKPIDKTTFLDGIVLRVGTPQA